MLTLLVLVILASALLPWGVDITVVAASVKHVSGPYENGVSGEALTVGQAVYKAADGKFYKAQSDGDATQAGTLGGGIVTSSTSGADQNVRVSKKGAIVSLGVGGLGAVYEVSATAGGLCPTADNTTGKFGTVATLCIVATDKHKVVWAPSGVARA